MVGEFQTANICLYATYLQPRIITAPFRERNAAPATPIATSKEDAERALDIFDKTVKRTRRLLSYLRENGYDITSVADNLRQLEDLRGDLTRVFSAPSGIDLRRHLQNVFEVRVVELCSAIRSLKDSEHTSGEGSRYPGFAGKDTAFPPVAGNIVSGKCDGA